MEVIIQEVVSTIHAVEGAAVPDPRTLGQFLRAVMAATEAMKEQDKWREADTSTGTLTGAERR